MRIGKLKDYFVINLNQLLAMTKKLEFIVFSFIKKPPPIRLQRGLLSKNDGFGYMISSKQIAYDHWILFTLLNRLWVLHCLNTTWDSKKHSRYAANPGDKMSFITLNGFRSALSSTRWMEYSSGLKIGLSSSSMTPNESKTRM